MQSPGTLPPLRWPPPFGSKPERKTWWERRAFLHGRDVGALDHTFELAGDGLQEAVKLRRFPLRHQLDTPVVAVANEPRHGESLCHVAGGRPEPDPLDMPPIDDPATLLRHGRRDPLQAT